MNTTLQARHRRHGADQRPEQQGSQFFIVLADDAAAQSLRQAPYAIFGEVISGMDVVDAIAAMPNRAATRATRSIRGDDPRHRSPSTAPSAARRIHLAGATPRRRQRRERLAPTPTPPDPLNEETP